MPPTLIALACFAAAADDAGDQGGSAVEAAHAAVPAHHPACPAAGRWAGVGSDAPADVSGTEPQLPPELVLA